MHIFSDTGFTDDRHVMLLDRLIGFMPQLVGLTCTCVYFISVNMS